MELYNQDSNNFISDEDVKDNSLLHDFNTFLDYVDKNNIKLTEKRNVVLKEVRNLNELFYRKEELDKDIGEKVFKFHSDKEALYFQRIYWLAKFYKCVHKKFNKIIISEQIYKEYCALSPAEQFIELFNTVIYNYRQSIEFYNQYDISINFLLQYLPLVFLILEKVDKESKTDGFVQAGVFLNEIKKYIDLEKLWNLMSKDEEKSEEPSFWSTELLERNLMKNVLEFFDIVELKKEKSFFDFNTNWKLTEFGKKFIKTYLQQKRDLESFSDGSVDDDWIIFNYDKEYCYYEGMERYEEGDIDTALMFLYQSIILDPNFVDGYNGLATVYDEILIRGIKNTNKVREYIDKAFQLSMLHLPFLNERVTWGVIENRQYLRAIANKAELFIKDGKIEEAKEMYKLLLKLNPNDNQGIRYILAGLYEGLTEKDIDMMFQEGNKKQNWKELEALVERQNKTHHFWEELKQDSY